MDQTAKEKLLRMVEENLAKEGQEIRLEFGPDEAADGSESSEQAGGLEIEGVIVQQDCKPQTDV